MHNYLIFSLSFIFISFLGHDVEIFNALSVFIGGHI